MPGESAHFLDIARVIQLAIAPVFLLTAIGTIINVLIGRLARAVDRRRILEEHLPEYAGEGRAQALRELGMLNRRITLVIWATALAVLAALLVCLLIFLREITIAAVSARQTVSPQPGRVERKKATAAPK